MSNCAAVAGQHRTDSELITLPDEYQDQQPATDIVERLMGRGPAKRFEFIQNSAAAVVRSTRN